MMQYPLVMQPTHARWERVHDDVDEASSSLKQLTTDARMEGTDGEHPASLSSEKENDTIFPPVNPIITKNFLVVDTVYENPSYSGFGIPGPDGSSMDLAQNNLSSIPQHLIDELPEDCRLALEVAQEKERGWMDTFGTESRDGSRRQPIIDKGIIL